MAYTTRKVYPLTKSTTKTLTAGAKQFLFLDSLTLSDSIEFADFATISGVVTTDASTNVSYAYVSLKIGTGTIDATPLYGTKTNADGEFSITVPQNTTQEYTLSVIATGYSVNTENISVQTSQITKNISLTADSDLVASSKAIIGKVTTGASTPVGSAFVTLYNNSTIIGLTVTNATGDYAFIGLASEGSSYTITVSHALYVTSTIDTITFTSSSFQTENISLVAISADNSKLIQGTISPATAGTTVILYKDPVSGDDVPIAYTKTNANGYYSFLINYDSQTDADTQYYVISTNNVNLP